jgi:hypothetical protein
MSSRNEVRSKRSWLAASWAALVFGALLWLPSCGEHLEPLQGSETHFLRACGTCAEGECRCGVCTRRCAAASECGALSEAAACVPLAPRVATQRCGAVEQASAICDVSCLSDSECAALSSEFRCEAGFCRVPDSHGPPQPAVCVAPQRAASDVVVLGDSLIEFSSFTASLEAAAQAAGALGSGETFRSYASHLDSFIAEGPLSIATEYKSAQADGIPRVIVMDGGATDLLNAPCGVAPTANCAAVTAAAEGAEKLFAQFAADGVEHVVYFFYPDYSAPRGQAALAAGLDVLRPLLQSACGRAAIACHWLDLRPLFAGHPDYLAADGIVLGDAGARVTANAVWSLIEQRCIAK